jgi:hypothetical protein
VSEVARHREGGGDGLSLCWSSILLLPFLNRPIISLRRFSNAASILWRSLRRADSAASWAFSIPASRVSVTVTRDRMSSTYLADPKAAMSRGTAIAPTTPTAGQLMPSRREGGRPAGGGTSRRSSSGDGRRPVLFGAEPRVKSWLSVADDVRVPSCWWYARRSSSVFSRPPERFLATHPFPRREGCQLVAVKGGYVLGERLVVVFDHPRVEASFRNEVVLVVDRDPKRVELV